MRRFLFLTTLTIMLLGIVGYILINRFLLAPPVVPYVVDPVSGKQEQITVLIYNGAGIPAVARKAMQYLRKQGFDVVDIGNYAHFNVQRSFVIDCIGRKEAAENVAEALGIPDSLIVRRIDSSLFVHCAVVIGKDVEQLKFSPKK